MIITFEINCYDHRILCIKEEPKKSVFAVSG